MAFKLLLLIAFIYTSACSTLNETGQLTPRPVNDSAATVYLYRLSAMSNAVYSPELYVNGEYKLSMKNGEHSLLTLPPGEVVFEIEPTKNYSGITQLTLTLSAGDTYYIRVDTSLKLKTSANYEPYQRSFSLVVMDDTLAISQIKQCCLAKKKISLEQKSLPETEDSSGDSFSIDKTQNPFSH